MGIRIDALNATASAAREHEVPAMKDGLTVKLTVGQILSLLESSDLAGLVDASAVSFTPAGAIAATDVQSAIEELETDTQADLTELASIISDALNLKAPLESPSLTGTPTSPTASPGDDSTMLATTAFVQDAVSSPEQITISGTGSVLTLVDTSNSNKTWLVEQNAGQFRVTESGVSTHFHISAGGTFGYGVAPAGGIVHNFLGLMNLVASHASNPVARIQNTLSGNLLSFVTAGGTTVGSVTHNGTNTTYATSSDYRMKSKIIDLDGFSERLDAVRPRAYEMGGVQTSGFIAHEFAAVYPGSVIGEKDAVNDEGEPIYQAMQASTSEVMADIIAEIQSLRARVAELEGASS